MKLRCFDHSQRVHVFRNNDGVVAVHRTDGSQCESHHFRMFPGQLLGVLQVLSGPPTVQDWTTQVMGVRITKPKKGRKGGCILRVALLAVSAVTVLGALLS